VVEAGELVGRTPGDGNGYVLPKAETDPMAHYPKATATYKPNHRRETQTTGWRPSCAHDAPTVPATVLDPFGGSGTVGAVAERLSRRAILIELSPAYVELAERRTAQTGLGLTA
jgi:hypothetical protein